jgi:light-harvesting complex 1 beta chain
MAANDKGISGLSEQEAKEIHSGFVQMTALFIGIALLAHVLMWVWRPWLGG